MKGDVIGRRLAASFGLYDALLHGLDPATLGRDLDVLPSNTIGQQLWCVTGARESYARALRVGEWAGFHCSLSGGDVTDPVRIRAALRAAGDEVLAVIADRSGAATDLLALELLEHEAQHHGQLIRYLYGLRLPIPGAWKQRYSLD